MERSVGSKKSIYNMLMTVLFYTTGFICGLRTVLWLAMHTLIPAISRIIALNYHYHPSSSSSPDFAPPAPTASVISVVKGARDAAAGQLFKLVRTAAGHDLLVPVPASMYPAAGSASFSAHTFVRLALLSSLIGAVIVAAYYYLCRPSAPVWTFGKVTRRITTKPALSAKTKLNPAAPAFTPTPTPAPLRRLDPTARTFAPRGSCATPPPSPAESVDSAGPATPSPSPRALAFAARAGTGMMGKGGATGECGGGRAPVGVGKMRVVRPEEVVVRDRRANEVFVFF